MMVSSDPDLRGQRSLSVVIPTYMRESVLLDTIHQVLSQNPPPAEILIVDQTDQHELDTDKKLTEWNADGHIRWIRLSRPSIPHAMNVGLSEASHPIVLFLDDDILTSSSLISAHVQTHESDDVWAVVGQVIQPWQEPEDMPAPRALSGLKTDFDFPFHSTRPATVENVMAGNLSVKRKRALQVGGFDENFVGSAYRFETDFARRIIRAGGRICFCPNASIRHLRISSGGTRWIGDHRASMDPRHGVGDHYYAMRHGTVGTALRYSAGRMIREVATRFHLRHPWWIPVKLLGELRAYQMARKVHRQGPKLLDQLDTSLDVTATETIRPAEPHCTTTGQPIV
jgi:GT2 family glycosyltransferase